MFCQNCGTKLNNDTKFCNKCGTAMINDVSHNKELINNNVIDTIPKLKDLICEIKNASEPETVFRHVLEAQLQVISIIDSPNLSESVFDMILESLNLAVSNADDKGKKFIQQKAAIMVNTVIFFKEAKLCYENKINLQEGNLLLKKACNMLAESTNEFIKNIKYGQHTAYIVATDKLLDNLTKEKGFFSKIFDFIVNKFQEKKRKDEFYMFLIAVFKKLERSKNIFGKSILLSELVFRYKDILSEWDPKLDECKKTWDEYINLEVIGIISLVIVILYLLIVGATVLINVFPFVNFDNIVNFLWFKKWIVISIVGMMFILKLFIEVMFAFIRFVKKSRKEKFYFALAKYFSE